MYFVCFFYFYFFSYFILLLTIVNMQIELFRTIYECISIYIYISLYVGYDLIDDSPSCEIIVYRCRVVQLAVCIILSS